MSGICGIFSSSPEAISEAAVSSMLQSMKHRGPDGTNVYANGAAGISLGQNHLNAFTPAAQNSAPAFALTDDFAIALEGCVTNRLDIFQSPPPKRLNPDVEAVLAAYQAYGADCLSKLDGPFSVALWDKQKRQLLLSRDKLGEKALYYFLDPAQKSIVFASEIKAILAHHSVRAELDADSLALYFAFGYIPGAKTLFKDIYKLLPGESLQVGPAGQPRRKKYWHLPPIVDGIEDEAYCIRQLKELFMRALDRYTNGCQDVAVFLSGGVDSSIIVAGLQELGVPRIHTFTIGFSIDPSNAQIHEDLTYARLVAEKFSTRHHEVVIEAGHNPQARLLRVIKQFDDLIMTPNSYSKYLLAEAVREAGLNSVLTGSAAAGACGVHRKFLDPEKRAELEQKTRECKTDEERYYRLRSRLFKIEEQNEFLREPSRVGKPEVLEVLHNYIGDIKSSDFFRLFLFSNLMITSTEKTLRVLDKAGILASVELRSPYLDRALVEFSTQLPSSFDGGKTYVSLKTHLKKAFEHILPRPVLERAVIGYPSYYWHNGELAEFQKRLFTREAVARNGIFNFDGVTRILEKGRNNPAKSGGKQSWALTQFGLWYEIYIKQNPEFTSILPN
jgi:asparagine synthase (glutamine-hydrolysing)